MKKIAVVYWSGTGNTEAMANAVCAGVREAGGDAVLLTATEFSGTMVDNYEAIGFGCSAMGAEELEESEFEPMFESCEAALMDKSIALFGSYGWGDGEWMESWTARCKKIGARLVCNSVICNDAPDDDGQKACRNLGMALVTA